MSDNNEVIIIKYDNYEMIDWLELRLLQDYDCCRDFDRGVAEPVTPSSDEMILVAMK